MKKYKLFLFFITFFIISSVIRADNKVDHKIAVLVNEDIITSFDIIQRIKLTAVLNGININADNNQMILNNVVDELIQEKVKLQKINEYKIKVDETEYLNFEENFLKRNNIDRSQLLLSLEDNSINYQELKRLLNSELLWSKLINGLYYRLTSVSDIEIDEIISKNPNLSNEQAESLVIQRQLDLQSSKLIRDIMNEATVEYK